MNDATAPRQVEKGGEPVSYTHLDVYKRQGVNRMSELLSFFLSVLASVVAYYICKWLDGEE